MAFPQASKAFAADGEARPTRRPWAGRWLLAAGLLLPPPLLLGWMVWSPVTLGNDYPFQVPQPAFLRFMTAQGLEPMWYPHLTGGVPIGGLFFAQYFHLPAWLASQLPGFWSGEALRLVGLRHLLLLGLAHALYYASLRRAAGRGPGTSYLLSFVCVYNLRNLDALRYGAGLDGTLYAQAVVLLALIHVLAPSRVLLVLLAVASQLLLTCGYPVAIPFAALAAALGLPILARLTGARRLLLRGSQALAAGLAGALLAAPGWIAFAEWLSVNEARVARPTIEWAAAWALPAAGLYDNAFRPWRAEVHSAFGGSTLLVLALATVLLALLRRWRSGWPILLLLALPFAYALGRATPVFPFFFEHVPGFASLRVPGRAFVMLPLALVLAVLWLKRAPRPAGDRVGEGLTRELQLAGAIAFLGGLAALVRLAVAGAAEGLPEHCAATLDAYWTPAHQALWLVLGLLTALAALAAHRSRIAVAVLAVAGVAQTGMLLRHGTWTSERPRSPTREDLRRAEYLPLYAGEPLVHSNDLSEDTHGTASVSYAAFARAAGTKANCFLPVQPGPRWKGILLPFYLSDRIVCAADRQAALRRLSEGCRPELPPGTVVLEEPCPWRAGPESAEAGGGLQRLNERNRIVALTSNLVTLEIDSPASAILVTPFPDATGNWSGWLDGRPAPLLRVDGAFLGLQVPSGRHTVGIRYFSRPLRLGYRIACATAFVLAAAGLLRLARPGSSRPALRAALRIGLLTALAAAGVAGYRAWERRFEANARREATLNNRYAALLARQIARWQGATASSSAVGPDAVDP